MVSRLARLFSFSSFRTDSLFIILKVIGFVYFETFFVSSFLATFFELEKGENRDFVPFFVSFFSGTFFALDSGPLEELEKNFASSVVSSFSGTNFELNSRPLEELDKNFAPFFVSSLPGTFFELDSRSFIFESSAKSQKVSSSSLKCEACLLAAFFDFASRTCFRSSSSSLGETASTADFTKFTSIPSPKVSLLRSTSFSDKTMISFSMRLAWRSLSSFTLISSTTLPAFFDNIST
mmetsp:Transcript_52179/g.89643  ORF Transcript_52179/g.89643 Transcript_52179/m.89643 type:complete len:236 (-) Transcript_52179:934-1641(-)